MDWKCQYCDFVGKSRRKLRQHKVEKHPEVIGRIAWNKGLTAKDNPSVARSSQLRKQRYASGELKGSWIGRKHTEEQKKKISETMKRKIANGEIESGYKLNHYSKGPSYPEQYFMDVFKNAGIKVEYNFQVGLYQLDFANPKSKRYVEIDGSQHYCDFRIAKHDIERTKNLDNLGWKLISRIRWSEFQKLSQDEKEKVCESLVKDLN